MLPKEKGKISFTIKTSAFACKFI